jgi:hypothetical protein
MASDDVNGPGGADACPTLAQAMAIAAMNAAYAQQQITVTAQTVTTLGASNLFSIETASLGIASKKLLSK